jgi:hypothetical protein
MATLKTVEISEIKARSAKSGGQFQDQYGQPPTNTGICWDTSENPTLESDCELAGEGFQDFNKEMTNLNAGMTYYVRAFATNSSGTSYGNQESFVTLDGIPTLSIPIIDSVSVNLLKVSYSISSDGGDSIELHGICISTDINEQNEDSCIDIGTGIGDYSATLDELAPETTFYVTSYAKNSVGQFYSEKTSASTVGITPEVSTLSVSSITQNSATINAEITDPGSSTVTERGICLSTNDNPTIADRCTQTGSGVGQFSVNFDELQADITYTVRAYAKNNSGISYGNALSFSTEGVSPRVVTSAVTNISTNGGTTGGNITSEGSSPVSDRGVCYAKTQNPGFDDVCISAGQGGGVFTLNISGLESSTKYYIRAYATNRTGSAFGTQVLLTTLSLNPPTVTTSAASSISTSSAQIAGNVSSGGSTSVTVRGVCLSTNQNPTTSANCMNSGSGTGSFSVTFTGLSPNVRYYGRAFATNSVGTSYGNEISFTTNGTLPTITTNEVTNIQSTSGRSGGNITSAGSSTVVNRGLCYSTTQNPSTSNSCISSGSGIGSFFGTISGLNPATLYYVRAFASNSTGTAYGQQVSFTTSGVPPTLGGLSISDITSNSARVTASVSNTGSSSVTSRGVCYSTSQNPTTNSSCVSSGSGSGSFAVTLSGLSSNSTYFLRSYATNSAGTSYSAQSNFSTLPNSGSSSHSWTFVSEFPNSTDFNQSHGIVVDQNNRLWNAPYYSTLRNNDSERINALYVWNENGTPASFSGMIGTVTGDTLLRFGPLTGINKGADGNIYVSSHGYRFTSRDAGAITGGVWNTSRSFIHVINPNTGQGIRVIDITRMRTETAAHAPNRPAVTSSGHVVISFVFPESPVFIYNPTNNWNLVRTVTNSKLAFSRTAEVSPDGSKIILPTSDGVYVYQGSIQNGYSEPTMFNSSIFSGSVAMDPLNNDVVYLSGSGVGNGPDAMSPYESSTYYGISISTGQTRGSFEWNYEPDSIYRIPRGIAFSPDGRTVYVSSFTDGSGNIQKFRRN